MSKPAFIKRVSQALEKENTRIAAFAVASVIVTLALFMLFFGAGNEIGLGPIHFADSSGMVDVLFNATNNGDEDHVCDFTVKIPGTAYMSRHTIPAQATAEIRIPVAMPEGKTEVSVDYICT